MPPVRLGPKELLEYNADYGVIICRECQYAIQKSALQSHLLRHKIFRHERQSLLHSIAQLNILEPEDVLLPPATCKPIEALPVVSGFRCTVGACESLYASSKRMRRHQLESHEISEADRDEPTVRSVSLQTFFRGTKIRYFEVAPPDPTTTIIARYAPGVLYENNATEEKNSRDEEEPDIEMQYTDVAVSAMPLQASKPAVGPDINLQFLTYFHQFTSVTVLSYPR